MDRWYRTGGTGYGTGDTAVGYGWYGGTVRVVHLVHVVSCGVNLYKIWPARSYSRSGTSGDKTKLQGGTTRTCHLVWRVDC